MRDLLKGAYLEILVAISIVVLSALALAYNSYKFIIIMLCIVIIYLMQKNTKLSDEVFGLHYELVELRFQLSHVLNQSIELQELIRDMTRKEELDDYNQHTCQGLCQAGKANGQMP